MGCRSARACGTWASTTASLECRCPSGGSTCRRGCICGHRGTGISTPRAKLTIERFMAESGISREQVTPFPISTYLDYVEWFRTASELQPEPLHIERLDRGDDGLFRAASTTGPPFLHAPWLSRWDIPAFHTFRRSLLPGCRLTSSRIRSILPIPPGQQGNRC